MKMFKVLKSLSVAMVCCLIIPGCINLDPVQDTTQFYILESTHRSQSSASGEQVFVRNIDLADYLRNSQLVQRAGTNKIEYLSGHRWAGSLENMIARFVNEELSNNESGYSVSPVSTGQEDLILDVRILRFDFAPGEQANVEIEYFLTDLDTREIVRHEWIHREKPLSGNSSIAAIINMLEEALREAIHVIKLN